MTATVQAPSLTSRLVNTLLSIKPLAALAKQRARSMMIQRAETIGVHWNQEVAALRSRDWQENLARVQNSNLTYPPYYLTSFHAYDEGNLGWEPALEVEVAAHAVHARIWEEQSAAGDARLRQSYHQILQEVVPSPRSIVDVGCSVGMSTYALQSTYPEAAVTGVDLSPYFLAVADYRSRHWDSEVTAANGLQTYTLLKPATKPPTPRWLHAAAEATGLPDAAFDLVSACLVFHELPQTAAIAVLREARRLLRPGGFFALMDMNPQSRVYAAMPPYILTLLKSTEPYLDQYFALDLGAALVEAGFEPPTIRSNSPRHRTVIARVPG